MPNFNLAYIQADLQWEDKEANFKHFSQLLEQVTPGTDLILLPETFTTAFPVDPKKYAEKGDVTLDEILKAVEDEDVLAIDGIGDIGDALGRGIAGIINIFNPGLVIVGGRLIVGGDYLMYPIKTAVNKLSLNRVSSDTTIRFSQLGRKAASIGDCLLSRSKLLGLPL